MPEDSSWTGKSLRELHLRQRFGVDLSSIHRGSHRLNIPNGDMIIFPGDKLQVIGNDDQLQKFNTALQSDLLPEEAEIEKREPAHHLFFQRIPGQDAHRKRYQRPVQLHGCRTGRGPGESDARITYPSLQEGRHHLDSGRRSRFEENQELNKRTFVSKLHTP